MKTVYEEHKRIMKIGRHFTSQIINDGMATCMCGHSSSEHGGGSKLEGRCYAKDGSRPCSCEAYRSELKGDTTQKRRQSRRREKLNEIAKASGFASWSAYETACLNGVAKPNKA